MQNALIWYIPTHFVTKNIDAFSIDLVYIEAKSNSKKTQPFSIWAATHNAAKRLIVLVVFKLNVPVNSFSVMSGRRHRLCFLGGWGCGASARSRIIKLEKPCVGINMI